MSDRWGGLGRDGLAVQYWGFGCGPISNAFHVVSDDEAEATLEAAWQAGVRYFDTAPHYGVGLGERRLGAFLATKPRDEFVVSTKVGRLLVDDPAGVHRDEQWLVDTPFRRELDYSGDGVRRSLEESLERMGLDRIDVVYVHDPYEEHEVEALDGALPALDALRSEGVIASYGVGVDDTAALARFIRDSDLDVAMCAGGFTLYDQRALDDLLPAALDRKVSVVAAAPYNSGLLSRDRPSAGLRYNYRPAAPEVLERVNALADACEAHGVTLPTAALQFPLLHTAVDAVCVGARTPAQVAINSWRFDEQVPDGLWQDLMHSGLVRRFPAMVDTSR